MVSTRICWLAAVSCLAQENADDTAVLMQMKKISKIQDPYGYGTTTTTGYGGDTQTTQEPAAGYGGDTQTTQEPADPCGPGGTVFWIPQPFPSDNFPATVTYDMVNAPSSNYFEVRGKFKASPDTPSYSGILNHDILKHSGTDPSNGGTFHADADALDDYAGWKINLENGKLRLTVSRADSNYEFAYSDQENLADDQWHTFDCLVGPGHLEVMVDGRRGKMGRGSLFGGHFGRYQNSEDYVIGWDGMDARKFKGDIRGLHVCDYGDVERMSTTGAWTTARPMEVEGTEEPMLGGEKWWTNPDNWAWTEEPTKEPMLGGGEKWWTNPDNWAWTEEPNATEAKATEASATEEEEWAKWWANPDNDQEIMESSKENCVVREDGTKYHKFCAKRYGRWQNQEIDRTRFCHACLPDEEASKHFQKARYHRKFRQFCGDCCVSVCNIEVFARSTTPVHWEAFDFNPDKDLR